jgi:hypothetical protein
VVQWTEILVQAVTTPTVARFCAVRAKLEEAQSGAWREDRVAKEAVEKLMLFAAEVSGCDTRLRGELVALAGVDAGIAGCFFSSDARTATDLLYDFGEYEGASHRNEPRCSNGGDSEKRVAACASVWRTSEPTQCPPSPRGQCIRWRRG